MDYKLFLFDVETTGVDSLKHHIWQISYKIFVNGQLAQDPTNLKFRPITLSGADPKAIEMSGLELEEMAALPLSAAEAYAEIKKDLDHYINAFNKKDKMIIAGYNVNFDERFFRQFFKLHNDNWYGSYFWSGRICALTLALLRLKNMRHTMPNFQLSTVAAKLGFDVDPEKAHDALYDVEMTEYILRLTGALPKWHK